MPKNSSNYSTIHVVIPVSPGKTIDKFIQYKSAGCKFYFNAQQIFLTLNPIDRSFFDYLCEKSDAKNRVNVDNNFKADYVKFITRITGGKKKVKEENLGKVIGKLKKQGLIFYVNSKKNGYFCVNPKYVFKGPENSRKKLLMDIVSFRVSNKLPVNMLIDIPEAEFLKPDN